MTSTKHGVTATAMALGLGLSLIGVPPAAALDEGGDKTIQQGVEHVLGELPEIADDSNTPTRAAFPPSSTPSSLASSAPTSSVGTASVKTAASAAVSRATRTESGGEVGVLGSRLHVGSLHELLGDTV